LCKGRTTIAIAHRLSTIMHADRILVVEDGSVVESGRHEELLRKGGRYAAFYRLQLKGHTPAREPVAAISR
jgi:ATP-binding cassette subfamily B protein